MTSKLRFLREMRGFSQDYVSQKLGVAQNTYSRWEIEERKIPKEILTKMADILGISKEDIENPNPIIINIQHANSVSGDVQNQKPTPDIAAVYEKLLAAKESEILSLKEHIAYLHKKFS